MGRESTDSRPIVVSVELQKPQRHNEILEADLSVNAVDVNGIHRFEYRWVGGTSSEILRASVEDPTVSYASVEPNSFRRLDFRAVDNLNYASEWYQVWSGFTPGAPSVIVAGDSIPSGYSRQWFTGDAVCTDGASSYGQTVVSDVAAKLPAAWQPRYTNIAWAGAGIWDMLHGGADSCGTQHGSQLEQIEELADEDSWNIIVVTAGINSTNWTDVVVDLTKDTAVSLTKDGDRRACDLALHNRWNIAEKTASITERSDEFMDALEERTNAHAFWTSYYDITGTELAPLWAPIGTECSSEMDEAMRALHLALRAGVADDATWVDIDGDIATQDWAGWPHPTPTGHTTIGHTIAEAINATL